MPLAFAARGAHSLAMADDLLSLPIDDDLLTVRTRQHAAGYAWELYRASKAAAVKFSVPIYGSEEAARLAGLDSSLVVGVPMEQMKRPAQRLKYSVMEMAALRSANLALLRPWQTALQEYIVGLTKQSPRPAAR